MSSAVRFAVGAVILLFGAAAARVLARRTQVFQR
jgi:hypothetical protein